MAHGLNSGGGSLRVLLVIDSLGGGGAEQSLAELLPHYVSDGILPTIVCLQRRPEGVGDRVVSSGFEVVVLPSRRTIDRTYDLRRLIMKRRPDLIHTTLFQSDVVGRLAAARTQVPVLTSLVNTTYEPIRSKDPDVSRLGLAAARTVDGWTARHLTMHFHAITKAVKDSAVKSLGLKPDRITVIERGRDPDRLGMPSDERKRRAREALGVDQRAVVLVNVGRQEFQKGQIVLLDALGSLPDDRFQLLITGRSGGASAELRRACSRANLRHRVRFLDHRDDVPEILAAGDLFVFPSLYEGLGGSLIEAMALGLPCVASRIPAIEEVVEESRSALLVEPGRADQLADAIRTVVEDAGLAHRLGSRGREIFLERFTLDRSARRMVQLYRDVAAKRVSRRSTDPRPPATSGKGGRVSAG